MKKNNCFWSIALCLLFSIPGFSREFFKIKIIDSQSGRGVPMVELYTLHNVRYLTDSNGYIAFHEPGLMGEKVYFYITGQGYEQTVDFLGFHGVALEAVPGDSALIALTRTIVAERLYRVTGAGIYRDSHLLGLSAPLKEPLLSGRVFGQDSNLGLIFEDKIFWIWGDTFRPDYPMGNFSISAATSELPQKGGLDPDLGVDLDYFIGEDGFSKKMIEIPGKGFVWFDWLLTLPDENGAEKLVAKYARVRPDFTNYERGIAVYNPQSELFERHIQVEEWIPDYHSTVHPVLVETSGEKMYYFTSEFYFQRAAPDLAALSTPSRYESFTCLQAGARFDTKNPAIERDAAGKPVWGWKRDTDAIDLKRQQSLIDSGFIQPAEAWLHLTDIETGAALTVNRGSIYWNEYRRRWVMIAGANVGEVWYAEGDTPLGPWVFAKKMADHQQLLYNPVHHPFLDKDKGRVIYFEGTYANTFLKEQPPAPWYGYNQLMYRLQLDDERLFLPAPVYEIVVSGGNKQYCFWDKIADEGLQKQVQTAAFMAFPPDRALPGLTPVYAKSGKNGDKFSDKGKEKPLFYALPAKPDSLSLFSGNWQCTATDGIFFTRNFSILLDVKEKEVTAEVLNAGMQIGAFQLKKDSLALTIQYFDEVYSLKGEIRYGKIRGAWEANIPGLKGTWEGQINDPLRFPHHLASLRPLYRYVAKNGKRQFYSTEMQLPDTRFEREAEPVCRVWQFPAAQLIFDADAKPGKGL